jgi:acyl-CoA thioester hydrolase
VTSDCPDTLPAEARGLSGRVAAGEHRLWLRVYYEDTDAAGIVYYANYLRYAERARTEMLRLIEVGQAALMADSGLVFAVKDCAVDYRSPARLDDLLEVRTRLIALGRAQLTAEQRIVAVGGGSTGEGRECAVLKVRVCCLNRAGQPSRMPPAIADALKPLCASRE